MELTNQYNLPSALVSALSTDLYFQPGHISVTGLIQPPRIRQLMKRHADKITEDVSDKIWMLLGTAVHEVLDKADVPDGFQEERLSLDVNGWRVTGKADLWEHPGILSDYKITSVWAYINGVKAEWEAQLNMYAAMYEDAGFPVDKLQIVCIFRDWQKTRAKHAKIEDNYPPCAASTLHAFKWPSANAWEYLEWRVDEHKSAEWLPDDELPLCTPEERWEKPTIYAVMKKGRKRSVRNLESKEVAERMVAEGKGDFVEVRPGASIRCADYCPANVFCNQYAKIMEGEQCTEQNN